MKLKNMISNTASIHHVNTNFPIFAKTEIYNIKYVNNFNADIITIVARIIFNGIKFIYVFSIVDNPNIQIIKKKLFIVTNCISKTFLIKYVCFLIVLACEKRIHSSPFLALISAHTLTSKR